MVGHVKLMTQAEYALHRGVSGVAVHKAVKSGRISTLGGKIDPAVADIQWSQNTRPRANRPRLDAAPPKPGHPGQVAALDGVSPPLNSAPDYWVARARRESAEATMSELRRAELEGKLIRVDAVRAAWAGRMSSVRESLLQISSRLEPQIGERGCRLLDAELRQALADLTKGDSLQGA